MLLLHWTLRQPLAEVSDCLQTRVRWKWTLEPETTPAKKPAPTLPLPDERPQQQEKCWELGGCGPQCAEIPPWRPARKHCSCGHEVQQAAAMPTFCDLTQLFAWAVGRQEASVSARSSTRAPPLPARCLRRCSRPRSKCPACDSRPPEHPSVKPCRHQMVPVFDVFGSGWPDFTRLHHVTCDGPSILMLGDRTHCATFCGGSRALRRLEFLWAHPACELSRAPPPFPS